MRYPVVVVWNPAQIEPRTWDAVIAFYRQIADQNEDFRPMQVLAQHIASGPHACALSGATSGTALLVAPHGVDRASGALRIDVDFAGTIRFVRQGRPPAKPSVTQHSTPFLIAAFDAFVRRSEWG
jgi:hypothetical protein